jgi:lipopolysaccharide/colanic/teichoic acid biosynthesis glycosyltransferase
MTHTLPTFALRKTKELILLNVQCQASTFVAPMMHYAVKQFTVVECETKMLRLQVISSVEDVPHAIIADYKLLSDNDFAFIRSLRSNLLTQNVPIIAIAEENEKINPMAVKYGIDDCYNQPIVWRDILDRIDFLQKFRSDLNRDVKEEDLDVNMSPWKRALDILVASFLILALSPILLLVALLIRLESKGPIIYRSKRSGAGYEIFDFLKFRSMYADADKRLEEIKHLNQYDNGNTDPTFIKVKNDPRITRIGRFIRKTSIDELPQLFNVLKGDMSLVGNRPLPLYEAECLTKEDWAYRFLAPAGITGLWQVSKRGQDNMSVEERISLDVLYAKNNSFWYDLKLLLRTPFAIIQKENV